MDAWDTADIKSIWDVRWAVEMHNVLDALAKDTSQVGEAVLRSELSRVGEFTKDASVKDTATNGTKEEALSTFRSFVAYIETRIFAED